MGRPKTGTLTFLKKQGVWATSRQRVGPFEYYRIRCEVRSEAPVLNAFQFFDGQGRELVSDDYCVFEPAPRWTPRERFTQVREDAAGMRFVVRDGDRERRVREVSVTPATAADVLAWSDQLYATLPPVECRLRRDRWRHFELTRQRLRAGQGLRLLVLGDSIANDISNSQFHLLVERAYPGSTVTLLRSMRAARGCRLFQHRVNRLIVAKQPDLVVIAGISHRCDADAVARVVAETRRRTGRPVEFLVTTSTLCDIRRINWRTRRRRQSGNGMAQAAERRFHDDLFARRDDLGIEVLDLRTLWEDYLAGCARPREWFQRDGLHANARGKQVLGRILARSLSP